MKINDQRWQEIDQQFVAFQGDVDLDNYLSPANRASELEKFREKVKAGESYNPQFTYDSVPEVHESELHEFLKELNPDDPVEKIYHDAVRFRLGEIIAATEHTGETVTTLTVDMFGKPDQNMLRIAKKNLDTIQTDQSAYAGNQEGKIYDAEELAQICREAMTSYGFDWKVVVKPEMGAKACVDNLLREFWIRADVKFHESLVKMIIVHEIGLHILRSENGYAQPLQLFGRGLPAYQYTEEGLAEYAEEKCGIPMEDTIYRISGRMIGVDMALTGTFWDVYLAMKDYFDMDTAFDIALRAKLGIADMNEPGSYTKDYTYLAGLLKVHEFFKTATQHQIDAVFAGKVGFHQLETVQALQQTGYLCKPKTYPEWM